MAKRTPYSLHAFLKDIIVGIVVSAGLLIAIFAVCRAIASRPLPPEVALPPKEVLACLDLKTGSGGEKITSSTHYLAVQELNALKNEGCLYRYLSKKDPGNPVLTKGLDLHARMTGKGFEKAFDEALKDKQTETYAGGLGRPLPEPAKKWLREHDGLVRAIHDFCITSGSVGVTDSLCRQLGLAGQPGIFELGFDFEFYKRLMITLNVAARLAIEENRLPEASQYTLDLLHLMERSDHLYPFAGGVFTARVENWIKTPDLPEADWHAFKDAMDRYAWGHLTRQAYRHEAARDDIYYRGFLIVFLYNSFVSREAEDESPDYFEIGSLAIPRPSFLTRATHKFTGALDLAYVRILVPRKIHRHDEIFGERFAYLEKPWREARVLLAMEGRANDNNRDRLFIPDLGNNLLSEAEMNLIRAAIDCLLHPERPHAQRIEGAAHDAHHPWRDPFTDGPLKVTETTTQTLIYSLGPDLEDQGGKVDYRQFSALIAPGDIVIRIPKERLRVRMRKSGP